MKSILIFCTRLRVYLIEIPLIILLSLAFHYNDKVDTLFRLYPLIIVLCFGIIFIAIFFFRAVTVSYDEIRFHGIFSSRDKELICEGNTLRLTIRPKGRIYIDLFGEGGAAFDWQKDSDKSSTVRLFHAAANGRRHTVQKILVFFTAEKELAERAVTEDGFSFENEFISVFSEQKNELFEVNIKILKNIV